MAAYTVTTTRVYKKTEPFQVVVQDERDRPVIEMSAMSGDHARMVAGALVMLLPKVDPRGSVVLDASINGGEWRRDKLTLA